MVEHRGAPTGGRCCMLKSSWSSGDVVVIIWPLRLSTGKRLTSMVEWVYLIPISTHGISSNASDKQTVHANTRSTKRQSAGSYCTCFMKRLHARGRVLHSSTPLSLPGRGRSISPTSSKRLNPSFAFFPLPTLPVGYPMLHQLGNTD